MGFLSKIFGKTPQTSASPIDSSTGKESVYFEFEDIDVVFCPTLTLEKVSTPLDQKLERIFQKVEKVKSETLDMNIEPDGIFDTILYEESPWSEIAINELETDLKTNLPDEFRQFLFRIGLSILPFYRPKSLRLETLEIDYGSPRDKKGAPPEWYDQLDKRVLPVSDFGCGIEFVLMLNGPEAGNLWSSDPANSGLATPIFPLNSGLDRVGFVDWFEYIIDEILSQLLEIKKDKLELT